MLAFIDKDKHWYVVRTNVKAEAKAAENIRKVGYETYLPRYRFEVKNHKTHTYSMRESPLMPRYLFVAFRPMDANFYRVNGCEGVECILSIDGNPVRISADSVETIFLAEIDMAFDRHEGCPYSPKGRGDVCEGEHCETVSCWQKYLRCRFSKSFRHFQRDS
jgi:transcriptional antiterminator NusG